MYTLIKYENLLKKIISLIDILCYSLSIIIISINIIWSFIIYIKEFSNPMLAYEDTRLHIGQAISISLSFILAVEILKLFYIKSYKQLIIVMGVSLLKLTISYFLMYEIESSLKDKKMYTNNKNTSK